MSRLRPLLHPFAATTVTVSMLLASEATLAGKTVIEFDATSGTDAWVPSSTGCGTAAASSCGVTFTNGSSAAIPLGLGFSAKIGDTSYDSVFINSSGLLTFGQAYTGGFSTANGSIAALASEIASPFIASNYADLGITSVPAGNFTPFGGGASYFIGTAVPGGSGSSAFLPAFATTWFGSADTNPSNMISQVVLYSTSASGDFDLRFRYGDPFGEPVTYTGALAGFSLGGSTETISNPGSFTDYFYSFVDGVLSSSGGGGSGGGGSGGGGGGGGGGVFDAPEIDPGSAASALTLLFGTLTLLRGRRRPANAAVS